MRIINRFAGVAVVCVFLCSSVVARAARVETVRLQSRLVNTTLPYNVILPPDYDSSRASSRATRYPVLYLLHGVVMPEGNDAWYTDSATIATDKYESHILQELLPDVQQRYRTIEARYGRAIAGLPGQPGPGDLAPRGAQDATYEARDTTRSLIAQLCD